jgi:hypothetical protein
LGVGPRWDTPSRSSRRHDRHGIPARRATRGSNRNGNGKGKGKGKGKGNGNGKGKGNSNGKSERFFN